MSDDEWETRLRSRFVRMFINFEFLSTRKRVAVFAFSGHGKYQASLTTDLSVPVRKTNRTRVDYAAPTPSMRRRPHTGLRVRPRGSRSRSSSARRLRLSAQ